MNNFDIDLAFGEIGEQKIEDLLSGKYKIEVKTERDKWVSTGNIVIEISYKGRPSGLTATEADWWIHCLNINGNFVGALMFPVEELNAIVDKLLARGDARITYGGDGNHSELVLLPLSKIYT